MYQSLSQVLSGWRFPLFLTWNSNQNQLFMPRANCCSYKMREHYKATQLNIYKD